MKECYVLTASYDKDLETTVGSDIPGCNRACDADDDGTEKRRPKTGHLKIIQHRGNKTEHCRIHYEDKQAHRDYRERQRKQEHQWPNECIDQAQKERGEYEAAHPFYPHTRDQLGCQE